jgi:hypothetical protein
LKKLREIAKETDRILRKSPLNEGKTVSFKQPNPNTSATSSHLDEVEREIAEIDRELEDDDL